jgi:hypothetical protein
MENWGAVDDAAMIEGERTTDWVRSSFAGARSAPAPAMQPVSAMSAQRVLARTVPPYGLPQDGNL